jgi:thiol-disulfide isomerase/thioredoxin
MRNLLWAIILCPWIPFAHKHGISFVENSSWQEILEKAKTEKKYIFVDCYASWCGPCKMMDKDVYPNDTVARFMNERFISVKLQMDTTKQDSKEIQCRYAMAHATGMEYSIHSYPTFLFISPDGVILHKAIGARNVQEFIDLVESATDPKQQYYTLLRSYNTAELNYAEMPNLAKAARELEQDSISLRVANDYIVHFLEQLPEELLWTKENIAFLSANREVISSETKIFQLYFRDRNRIDSLMNVPNYSRGLINNIIFSKEITPKINAALEQHFEPDWEKIEKTIAEKYDKAYVRDNMLKGRVQFYKATKKWNDYAKYLVLRYENAGAKDLKPSFDNGMLLNNAAFEVFKYSADKNDLETALSWVEHAIAMNMNIEHSQDLWDTKANILYKLGRKKEAIALETKSVDLKPDNQEVVQNFQKMKSGLPTWPPN